MKRIFFAIAYLIFLLAGIFIIRSRPAFSLPESPRNATSEHKTLVYFESIRAQPLLLIGFLREMPKGGDLHNHLSGSVYAETYIALAAQRGLYVDPKTMTLIKPEPTTYRADLIDARTVLGDSNLYQRTIDAWSMRNYVGPNGRNQFFDSFGKFSGVSDQFGEMLAEVVSRAAAQREAYLELMLTPDLGKSGEIGQTVWDDDFGKMRETLVTSSTILDSIALTRNKLDYAEAKARALLKCGTPEEDAGCRVTVRYIFQIGRRAPKERSFAQMLAAFENSKADQRIVGLNLVQPEDDPASINNFSLQMRMLEYLHTEYPNIHISLHAGELAPGFVRPEDLRFHIRESIEKGHAERIGHGVDIMYEDDPLELLREMEVRNVMVEICLTSNDLILGVRGNQHPFSLYRKYGVPLALATDDEGVSRSDMTHEYLKAVQDQGAGYVDLKTMARTSLEHAFVRGESLWNDGRRFVRVQQCASDDPQRTVVSAECQRFLDQNERSRLQWALEKAFKEFESKY